MKYLYYLTLGLFFLASCLFLKPNQVQAAPMSRLAGADRVLTSIVISQGIFPDHTANCVVIATKDKYPDGISAGPLAATCGGPVLLNPSTYLDPAIAAEIIRLWNGTDDPGVVDIWVVGGDSAINNNVVTTLSALNPLMELEVVAGGNRYETSANIAVVMDRITGTTPQTIFVTTGNNFPDALSSSAIAANKLINGRVNPVLLTPQDYLHAAPDWYIANTASITTAYVIGGQAAVSENTKIAIEWYLPTVVRIAGDNRYRTAAEVARYFFGAPITFGSASGTGFADALGGGVHSAFYNQPILLVNENGVPVDTTNYLRDFAPTIQSGYIYGGPAVIPDWVMTAQQNIYDEV